MRRFASVAGGKRTVAVIGSGNWGTAAAKVMGLNTQRHDMFETKVNMWVHEETVDGRKLSEIINEDHENVKYLKGIRLPKNLVAQPSLEAACEGADTLVFVLPHQFLPTILPTIKRVTAQRDVLACSLIKGIGFEESGIQLLSNIIRTELSCDVSVLMGANVANEVAAEEFSEATIGGNPDSTEIFKKLFQTDFFRITCVENADAVELFGALKNVVALGAGFCDGLGLGNNTKAAIIRIGLIEIAAMIKLFTGGDYPYDILIESCGLADMITTCYGGRNKRCAEAFVKTGKTWDELEAEILNGQKLQGTLTCAEVHEIFTNSKVNVEEDFPLFKNIYRISFEGAPPSSLVSGLVKDEKKIKALYPFNKFNY
mmetsp:Transcript_11816/g.21599  ORF Transcript_11816/g.21599 Transcript_11816/m.21599 type:complete len:371 (+) Transcript_11816:508-1620(+)